MYSSDEFWELCDKMARAASTCNRGQLRDMVTIYGLNYEPHGVLYDMQIRQVFNCSKVWYDWMYFLVASGRLPVPC